MSKQHIALTTDNFYHVYNRAIGSEKLFISKDNYRYFLQKINLHVLPVADLFAYSLLPNHFHLLIRIKAHDNLTTYFKKKKSRAFDANKHNMSEFIMERFSNCLNAYTKVFNIMHSRKGGLFIDYTKRSEARSESDLISFILYIHQNAVHHGLRQKIGEWPFDSFQAILRNRSTYLKTNEVVDFFGTKPLFEEFHKQPITVRSKRFNDT